MLKLDNIVKVYGEGDNAVSALKGVSLEFRKSEFVAILGSSGCGKTTLLNIIGGLDRYTSGDLFVAEKSTKSFKDKDWDAYRNNSIGFVFQSYNLITHQTVLANVEMALTLAGISAKERKKRAIAALEKVGLGDKIKKRPNQLSGGQMQRVAIARALINDPEIILADEPTGALDSETSAQVMDVLKEISKDRLVIMVTHNGDLADTYATRIVRLHDGEVVSDSAPLDDNDRKELQIACEKRREETRTKKHKTSMKITTAFMLSLKNLLTKKTRTILTAFAGSIGIIGVALVLAVSSGVNAYIDRLQKDTLSSYPMTMTSSSVDFQSMIATYMSPSGKNDKGKKYPKLAEVYVSHFFTDFMAQAQRTTDINKAIALLEDENKINKELYYSVQKSYATTGAIPFYIETTLDKQFTESQTQDETIYFNSDNDYISKLVDNEELLESQYDILNEGGYWPKGEIYKDENGKDTVDVVLCVDQYNEISDLNALFVLGDVKAFAQSLTDTGVRKYTFDELSARINNGKMKVLVNDAYFKKLKNGDTTYYRKDKNEYALSPDLMIDKPDIYKILQGLKSQNKSLHHTTKETFDDDRNVNVHVSAIVRLKQDTELGVISGLIGFPERLDSFMREQAQSSEVYKAQVDSNVNVFSKTGETFETGKEDAKRKENFQEMGYSETPNKLSIFAKNFKAKQEIKRVIDDYNSEIETRAESEYENALHDKVSEGADYETAKKYAEAKKNEVLSDQVHYTDVMDLLMSMLTKFIDIVTIALVGFTAISLVVSSIMIGIITYISVLERTKEIGILRAIGARKKDITRVFNAESGIIGLTAGIIGIGISLIISAILNVVLAPLTGIAQLAFMRPLHCVLLVVISIALTLIAGLIPALIAAKRDPVTALRTD